MSRRIRIFIASTVATVLLVCLMLWWFNVSMEQQRLRARVISALASQNETALFGTISEEEKKQLDITPQKIRRILIDIGFWTRPRKGGVSRPWIRGGNNPLIARDEWVVEWLAGTHSPLMWPDSTGAVSNPASGLNTLQEFSVLTFNKPQGWSFYLLPGWHFNFSSLVFSHCLFTYKNQEASSIRRNICEQNGVPGYLSADGLVRRFDEIDQ